PSLVVDQTALVGIGIRILLAVGAHLVLVDGQPAGHVEAVPRFDLDDLGPEVGQHAGGDRTHSHPTEVGDADSRQRADPLPRPARGGRRRRLINCSQLLSPTSSSKVIRDIPAARSPRNQYRDSPPSTMWLVPVTKLAAGEHR